MRRIILIGIALLIGALLILGGFFFRKKKGDKEEKDLSKIRVEIVNCSGIYEVGKEIMEELRKRGVNVYDVYFDRDTLPETFVVERSDEKMENALIIARRLAKVKKIGILRRTVVVPPQTRKEINHDLFIDVTILIGRDFKTFFPTLFSVGDSEAVPKAKKE